MLALAALVLAGAAATAPARASSLALVAAPSPWQWSSEARPFQIPQSASRDLSPSRVARIARGSWWGGPVATSTGETVTLFVSDSFAQNEEARVSWANFFAWLYHGSELATIQIYQAPLSEVEAICGAEAAGCYSPSAHVMIFPGDLDQGIDADIGAHEYGHHVAASRNNDPWDPDAYGPKRWSTSVGVCARAAAGTVFPGDEGDHYTLNTGEAWAEAYRILNEQRGGTWAGLPLVIDSSLAPTAGSLAAALADVQQPWNGPVASTWDGTFGNPSPAIVKLTASIGPGARISLRTAAGAPVRSTAAGVYAITVRDASTKDNFHLTGVGGVNRHTGVPGKGTVTWKLALEPGVYRFRSDSHPALAGSFTITSAPRATGAAGDFPPQERTIPTSLDGSFAATAGGTANPTLELVDPATGAVLVPAATGSISFTICGQRAVQLRVSSGRAGRFHLELQTP